MSQHLLKQDGFYRLADGRIICVKTWSETNAFLMYRESGTTNANHATEPSLLRMDLNTFYELNPTLI